VPQSVWTYPADSAAAVNGPFRRIGEIVEFFSRTFGEFPYDELAHVEAATLFGGMENAGAIWYDQRAIATGRLTEATVAHETGHQWFGDAVTEGDWHHLWLSEGFATYLAALWAEHTGGDSALAREMQENASAVFGSKDTERPILDLAATDLMGLLNTNNYPKGAWVLHTLRGLVGDTTFFRGMRDYYATYRNGNALSSDFARVMSKAAGSDLDWYFLQALTQPGYPVLEVSSRVSGGKLVLALKQVQKPEWGLYRMPGLELLVDGQLVRVDLEGRETTVTLDGFKANPKRIEVDPNGWWLVRQSN
jgi:aminopeptidase N